MDSEHGAEAQPPADKRYEYFAFISYKHEDMRWAKWLQNRLETYRLPSVIRKEVPHLPKHIRPIFRDQTDIGTGPLLENLRKELDDSRFLDRRLFAIGVPIGMGQQGSTELHPDGPGRPDHSVYRGGRARRRRSKPGVFSSGFARRRTGDARRQRGRTWQGEGGCQGRRQAARAEVRPALGPASPPPAATTPMAWADGCRVVPGSRCWQFRLWDYYRTKVAYYADYVECRGVPQGIGELSAAQVRHRHFSWKFESSRYRVDRVCSINGSGRPTNTEDADRPGRSNFPLPR